MNQTFQLKHIPSEIRLIAAQNSSRHPAGLQWDHLADSTSRFIISFNGVKREPCLECASRLINEKASKHSMKLAAPLHQWAGARGPGACKRTALPRSCCPKLNLHAGVKVHIFRRHSKASASMSPTAAEVIPSMLVKVLSEQASLFGLG